MKIAVLCANGRSGKCVVDEALKKGLKISAFVRDSKKATFNPSVAIIERDIFNLDSKDLMGFDIIVDAFGELVDLSLHLKHIQHLANILQDNKARLVIIGGAGSLYMDKTHTTRLMDTKDFPQEYMGVAKATAEVLDFIRTQNKLNWLYISPAAIYDFEGERSGEYEIIGEEFATNTQGQSYISYKDYALALIDIATSKDFDVMYRQKRISLLAKSN